MAPKQNGEIGRNSPSTPGGQDHEKTTHSHDEAPRKNSSPHIRHMLKLMTYITFAKAHKAAKEAALPESAEKA